MSPERNFALITVRVTNEMVSKALTRGFEISAAVTQGLPKGCTLVGAFVGAHEDLVLSFRAPAEFTRDMEVEIVLQVPKADDPFGDPA